MYLLSSGEPCCHVCVCLHILRVHIQGAQEHLILLLLFKLRPSHRHCKQAARALSESCERGAPAASGKSAPVISRSQLGRLRLSANLESGADSPCSPSKRRRQMDGGAATAATENQPGFMNQPGCDRAAAAVAQGVAQEAGEAREVAAARAEPLASSCAVVGPEGDIGVPCPPVLCHDAA